MVGPCVIAVTDPRAVEALTGALGVLAFMGDGIVVYVLVLAAAPQDPRALCCCVEEGWTTASSRLTPAMHSPPESC